MPNRHQNYCLNRPHLLDIEAKDWSFFFPNSDGGKPPLFRSNLDFKLMLKEKISCEELKFFTPIEFLLAYSPYHDYYNATQIKEPIVFNLRQ